MLTIERLSKSFGKFKVLDDINVALQAGRSVSLIGPNGLGKTTLIKCILGLVVPDSGSILLGDRPVLRSWQYRRQIGYMPQIGRYPDNMRVRQVIDMICELRGANTPIDSDLFRSL